MRFSGNIDRELTEDECRVAGQAAASFMRALGSTTREQAVYALSVIVMFMANNDKEGQFEIIEQLKRLVK